MSQKPRNLSDMTLVGGCNFSLSYALSKPMQPICSTRNATYFLMETPSWPISVVDTGPSAICGGLCWSGDDEEFRSIVVVIVIVRNGDSPSCPISAVCVPPCVDFTNIVMQWNGDVTSCKQLHSVVLILHLIKDNFMQMPGMLIVLIIVQNRRVTQSVHYVLPLAGPQRGEAPSYVCTYETL